MGPGGPDPATAKPFGGTVVDPRAELTRADVRRLLNHLREPYRLAADPAAAVLPGEPATGLAPSAIGAAVAKRMCDGIDRLRPAEDASRHEQLPYLVLKTCFVDGVKMLPAADRLVLSRRQLTRECANAVERLHAELCAPASSASGAGSRVGEPIPIIAQFMARPHVTTELRDRLASSALVHVHGPKGIGKTSLVAELASASTASRPVVWHRFRPGMNTSWSSLSFDLAEYLKSRGFGECADYLARSLGTADAALVAR